MQFLSSEEDIKTLKEEANTAKEDAKKLEGELAAERSKVEKAVADGKANAARAQASTEKKMKGELEKVRI